MGQVKSAWMESEERGWDEPDKFVCADCVEDDFLKVCIQNNVEVLTCSYCGHQSSEFIAAPAEAIMHYIGDAFFIHFAEPDAAGLPGGSDDWIGLTDTADALSSLPLFCNENLFVDIVDSFHYSEWIPCAKGHWMGEHASTRWMWDWEHFKRTVKTKTRYFFTSADLKKDDFEEEYSSPSNLLNRIGFIAEDLKLYEN